MHEAAVMAEFDSWFFDNGGDEDLLDLLKSNGFYSKLSLANLDLTSPDAVTLMDSINYGQKCLLRGLVSKLCSSELPIPVVQLLLQLFLTRVLP